MIGINSAGVAEAQSIGFAINVGIARHVFEDLVKYGEPRHPYLGITAADVSVQSFFGSAFLAVFWSWLKVPVLWDREN